MCGIFGEIRRIHDTHDRFNFDKSMSHAMKCSHRGPDNTSDYFSTYRSYHMYFVFHRLAINGLDENSNQPMKIQDVVLLCNGEIYNYKDLAKKYKINLITNSDCEIIIHLYKLLGIQCINLLDGVFTFVLVDHKKGLVYVGHDPIGIRSGYMAIDDNSFTIASEMKSIAKKQVTLIPPGSYLEFNLNTHQKQVSRYFHLEFPIKHTDDHSAYVLIRELLYESVRKRLMSDQPIGCLLSGGIDSSIICYLVNELSPHKTNTFSIGLDGSPDLQYAEKVAEYLGTNHTTFVVSEQEMLDAIEPTIKQIESYDTTTVRASVPMYLLSKKIKKTTDVKVIFSGEGADELSGSYLYFHKAPSAKEFQEECIRLVKDVQHFDVLRGDKTTAGNGLEIRVPFFDKQFVKEYMSIDPKLKMVRDGYEKYLLRKSFEGKLPDEVIWRRKDGFSDGVSCMEKPWYQIIDEYTQANYNLSEDLYYQSIFQKYYPDKQSIVPYQWLPKWTDETNPSGRLILD